MANKAAIGLVFGIGLATGAFFLISRTAQASPGPLVIPTTSDIMDAKSLDELEVYYYYIGELLISGEIDTVTYEELYEAYATRFHQLAGT